MVPREKDYGFVIMARLSVCACVPVCVSGEGRCLFSKPKKLKQYSSSGTYKPRKHKKKEEEIGMPS